MSRTGVLYVLLHYNSVQPGDINPFRDFQTRLSSRFRNYPVLTDTRLIYLPKFDKKVSMHKIFDILGIELRDTKFDRVKKRTTGNKCPIDDCTYYAESEMALRSHIHSRHSRNVFRCKYPNCDKAYKNKCKLKQHMLKKHGMDLSPKKRKNTIKKYPCTFPKCEHNIFNTPQALKYHRQHMHRGRVFKCKDCIKSFERPDILRNHMWKIHKKKLPYLRDMKPPTDYKCHLCKPDKFYASQESLFKHYTDIHKLKNVSAMMQELNKRKEA